MPVVTARERLNGGRRMHGAEWFLMKIDVEASVRENGGAKGRQTALFQ